MSVHIGPLADITEQYRSQLSLPSEKKPFSVQFAGRAYVGVVSQKQGKEIVQEMFAKTVSQQVAQNPRFIEKQVHEILMGDLNKELTSLELEKRQLGATATEPLTIDDYSDEASLWSWLQMKDVESGYQHVLLSNPQYHERVVVAINDEIFQKIAQFRAIREYGKCNSEGERFVKDRLVPQTKISLCAYKILNELPKQEKQMGPHQYKRLCLSQVEERIALHSDLDKRVLRGLLSNEITRRISAEAEMRSSSEEITERIYQRNLPPAS